jgi:hypothetical protein
MTSVLGLSMPHIGITKNDLTSPKNLALGGIAATGLVGGKVVTLGFFTAQVFPDAVTAVTFRGMRPFQLPAK